MKEKIEQELTDIVVVKTERNTRTSIFVGDGGEEALDVDTQVLKQYYKKLKEHEELVRNLLFQRRNRE